MRGRVRMLLIAAFGVLALTGCELKDNGDNLVNGKTLFVEKCSACHELARAGAKGVVGPSLDQAWQQANADGFGRSTYEGVVHRQILQPNRRQQVDPATGKPLPLMPAKLVTGDDAQDVAAYVAYAADAKGKDAGRLAQAGAAKQEDLAKAEGGKLAIPADPGGRTLYTYKNAEAPAGALEIDSKNDASVDHNIALEGAGVNEVGDVVKGGGTSTIQVDVKPGEYTFYCSVDGHRAGGMEGKLTVK